jgi:hypothetical protein
LSRDIPADTYYLFRLSRQSEIIEKAKIMSGSNARVLGHFITPPLLLMVLTAPTLVEAHGFAGKRYFPATLTFDDPFTQDEFGFLYSSMPNVKNEDGDAVDISALSVDYAKAITPGFALSIGTAYTHIKYPDDTNQHGFDNIEIGGKILGNVYEESESVWSYGLDIDLGGTSSHGIGESFSVYSPSFYFGKGFGNLFDSASYLRPLALTGKISVALPDQSDQPRSLDTAFAAQYSMSYLESFVKNVGAPRFLHDSFLIIELPLQTCLDHGCDGDVTGTVNPGIIFFNHWGQLSFEAQIPVNDRTGDSVGGLVQLHFNLDDVFPDTLGKPIFQ